MFDSICLIVAIIIPNLVLFVNLMMAIDWFNRGRLGGKLSKGGRQTGFFRAI